MDMDALPTVRHHNHLQLPDVLANVTLGMLIGDVGLMQYANTTMENLSEQLTEQLLAHNIDMAGLDMLVGNASGRGVTDADAAAAEAAAAAAAHAHDPLLVVVPVTICYLLIFVAGLLGNVITCTVISRNKSMHTATNYYLFNLAISDLMLLVSGLPVETYNIWYPASYPVSQSLCILQGLLSETSSNATVLTITSFTVERYIAICHPFRQHTMSKLSRAIRFIMAIWIVAFCLAIPQACQFGVVVNIHGGSLCTVKNVLVEHAFEVSGFVFFVGPMTLICVLYVLIGIKLHKSKLLQGVKRRSVECGRNISGQTRVIRMLVAVAVAFFLCWAPFHAQRLMAVYGKSTETTVQFRNIYLAVTYVSGVLYFLSTCINPLLYSIMSHKFRDAFKTTLARQFGLHIEHKKSHTYSALSKCGNGNGSIRLTASMLAATGGGPLNQRHTNILHHHHQHHHHQLLHHQPSLQSQHHQHNHHHHHHHQLHQHHNQHHQLQQHFHCHDTPTLTAVTVHRAPLAPHDDDLLDDIVCPRAQQYGDTFGANAHRQGTVDGGSVGAGTTKNSSASTQHHHTQCLIHSRCPHRPYQRHRCISVSSQATLLTTVSRNDALSASQLRLDQAVVTPAKQTSAGSTSPPNGVAMTAICAPKHTNGMAARKAGATAKSTLGSLAEKLRRGTRKVLQFTSASNGGGATNNCGVPNGATPAAQRSAGAVVPMLTTTPATASVTPSATADSGSGEAAIMVALLPADAVDTAVLGCAYENGETVRRGGPPLLQKHDSIDSGRTNTISNSSLQEVDAEEFDSAELTKHMGEINNEINALQCCTTVAVAVGGGAELLMACADGV